MKHNKKDDDDCDGEIDEATTAYDDDGDCYCEDGYNGSCTGSAEPSCGTLQLGDCNDSSAAAYPGASEGLYDNFDSDCDGNDYAYDLADGETRFNQVCSSCHSNYAPDLYTVVPALSAQQIYDIIINGVGYMAPQGNNPNMQNTQDRVNTAEYVWQTYQ